jgi:hypothetical protein
LEPEKLTTNRSADKHRARELRDTTKQKIRSSFLVHQSARAWLAVDCQIPVVETRSKKRDQVNRVAIGDGKVGCARKNPAPTARKYSQAFD